MAVTDEMVIDSSERKSITLIVRGGFENPPLQPVDIDVTYPRLGIIEPACITA